MKKAVIVIEMPKSCWECPVVDGEYGDCQLLNKQICDDDKRMEDCPLRPLPEKWEIQPYNSQSRVDWKIGYNNCLDDIQGIEDKNERENQWWAEHSSRFD